jgi:hypothetical protein
MALLPCLKSGIAIVRFEVFWYASKIHFLAMTLFHPVQPHMYIYIST